MIFLWWRRQTRFANLSFKGTENAYRQHSSKIETHRYTFWVRTIWKIVFSSVNFKNKSQHFRFSIPVPHCVQLNLLDFVWLLVNSNIEWWKTVIFFEIFMNPETLNINPSSWQPTESLYRWWIFLRTPKYEIHSSERWFGNFYFTCFQFTSWKNIPFGSCCFVHCFCFTFFLPHLNEDGNTQSTSWRQNETHSKTNQRMEISSNMPFIKSHRNIFLRLRFGSMVNSVALCQPAYCIRKMYFTLIKHVEYQNCQRMWHEHISWQQ